ncbi:hypothetical protein ISR94_00690 [Candidatus Microgenomates bacterium]|nr:hypothetical protein [Candidatus Microgenomates bacterium]
MKSKKKLPAVVVILILTLITAVFWIFFGAYRSFTNETEAVVPNELLLPLSPKLDGETIEKIKERKHLGSITESFVIVEQIESTPIPESIIITPSPEATQEASLEEGL